MSDMPVIGGMCDGPSCVKSGSKRCATCKMAKYCSTECQNADWARHKLDHAKWKKMDASLTPAEAESASHLQSWTKKNRSALAEAAFSSLDILAHPENAANAVIEIRLTRSGAKEKKDFYAIQDATMFTFEELEEQGFKNGEMAKRERNRYEGDVRTHSPNGLVVMCLLEPDDGKRGELIPTAATASDLHQMHLQGYPVKNWAELLLARCSSSGSTLNEIFSRPTIRVSPDSHTCWAGFPEWSAKHSTFLSRLVPLVLGINKKNSNVRENAIIIYLQRSKSKTFEACSVGLYTAEEVGRILSSAEGLGALENALDMFQSRAVRPSPALHAPQIPHVYAHLLQSPKWNIFPIRILKTRSKVESLDWKKDLIDGLNAS